MLSKTKALSNASAFYVQGKGKGNAQHIVMTNKIIPRFWHSTLHTVFISTKVPHFLWLREPIYLINSKLMCLRYICTCFYVIVNHDVCVYCVGGREHNHTFIILICILTVETYASSLACTPLDAFSLGVKNRFSQHMLSFIIRMWGPLLFIKACPFFTIRSNDNNLFL